MTYHLSTTRRAPYEQLHDDALEYLVEVFGAELWRTLRDAPPIHAADQLYELVGSDPKRLGAALALLELVERARAMGCYAHFAPVDGLTAGDVSVSHAWTGAGTIASDAARLDEDLGDACRRLIAQLKDGEA